MLTKHDVLTVDEAKAILKVSRKTLYSLIRSKRINAVKVGRGWRILRVSIEDFLTTEVSPPKGLSDRGF